MSVLAGKERIGICGATSTPRWLMNKVKSYIEERLGYLEILNNYPLI